MTIYKWYIPFQGPGLAIRVICADSNTQLDDDGSGPSLKMLSNYSHSLKDWFIQIDELKNTFLNSTSKILSSYEQRLMHSCHFFSSIFTISDVIKIYKHLDILVIIFSNTLTKLSRSLTKWFYSILILNHLSVNIFVWILGILIYLGRGRPNVKCKFYSRAFVRADWELVNNAPIQTNSNHKIYKLILFEFMLLKQHWQAENDLQFIWQDMKNSCDKQKNRHHVGDCWQNGGSYGWPQNKFPFTFNESLKDTPQSPWKNQIISFAGRAWSPGKVYCKSKIPYSHTAN